MGYWTELEHIKGLIKTLKLYPVSIETGEAEGDLIIKLGNDEVLIVENDYHREAYVVKLQQDSGEPEAIDFVPKAAFTSYELTKLSSAAREEDYRPLLAVATALFMHKALDAGSNFNDVVTDIIEIAEELEKEKKLKDVKVYSAEYDVDHTRDNQDEYDAANEIQEQIVNNYSVLQKIKYNIHKFIYSVFSPKMLKPVLYFYSDHRSAVWFLFVLLNVAGAIFNPVSSIIYGVNVLYFIILLLLYYSPAN